MMPQAFEILAGLPPYGPPAESFSATGRGRHREGFVVRFGANTAEAWVGNFQHGLGGLSNVFPHPNGREFVVIAKGQGYVVDPNDRTKCSYLDSTIDNVISISSRSLLVLSNNTNLSAIGPGGFRWETRRLSWDGIYDLRFDENTITGTAWSPLSNDVVPFTVDVLTGDAIGGSY